MYFMFANLCGDLISWQKIDNPTLSNEVHRRCGPLRVRALQGGEDEKRDAGRLLPHAEEWVRRSPSKIHP